jgi:hypothetical protein
MRNFRRLLRWAVVVSAVWIAFSAIAGVVAMDSALHVGRSVAGASGNALAHRIAAQDHADLADVAITASDGAVLHAWFIRPGAGKGDAAILLHGVGDNRSGMLGNAELLLSHGYSVLLPDARAHGASGGGLTTYGVEEAADVRRWLDWIDQTQTPHCIYGLGESMGAGQLLRSLAEVPSFCAVVAESPFASFREAGYDRLGERFNAGPWVGRTLLRPALEAGLLYARWRYRLNFDSDSPENAVAASRVPVLLIHGLRDTNLPARHSEMIQARNRMRSPAVALWEPAEAGHCGAASAEPAEFERRVIGWFESHPNRP